MAQNPEYLSKLLEFIKLVIHDDGNKKFTEDLRKALKVESSASSYIDTIAYQKIENIESYLGINVLVDNKDSVIDYSFIGDSDVQLILTSDNREMLRHRYGSRYHKIDFCEYCRYAVLQVEMLLNYYFSIRFNFDVCAAKSHIKSTWEEAKIDKCKSIPEIPVAVKIVSFGKEVGLGKDVLETLSLARETRNQLSHRSPGYMETIEELQTKLKRDGLSFKKEGSIDKAAIYKIENEVLRENMWTIYNGDIAKQYSKLVFMKKMPFDDVMRALEKFTAAIKQSLMN